MQKVKIVDLSNGISAHIYFNDASRTYTVIVEDEHSQKPFEGAQGGFQSLEFAEEAVRVAFIQKPQEGGYPDA